MAQSFDTATGLKSESARSATKSSLFRAAQRSVLILHSSNERQHAAGFSKIFQSLALTCWPATLSSGGVPQVSTRQRERVASGFASLCTHGKRSSLWLELALKTA